MILDIKKIKRKIDPTSRLCKGEHFEYYQDIMSEPTREILGFLLDRKITKQEITEITLDTVNTSGKIYVTYPEQTDFITEMVNPTIVMDELTTYFELANIAENEYNFLMDYCNKKLSSISKAKNIKFNHH